MQAGTNQLKPEVAPRSAVATRAERVAACDDLGEIRNGRLLTPWRMRQKKQLD